MSKESKNNVKNNHIDNNQKSDYFIEENGITYENHNNNPEFESVKDLKELNGILVWYQVEDQWYQWSKLCTNTATNNSILNIIWIMVQSIEIFRISQTIFESQ